MILSEPFYSISVLFIPESLAAFVTFLCAWNPALYGAFLTGLFSYQFWIILRHYQLKNHSVVITAVAMTRLIAFYLHLFVHSLYETNQQYKPYHLWDALVHLLLLSTSLAPFYLLKGLQVQSQWRMFKRVTERFILPVSICIIGLECSRFRGHQFLESMFIVHAFDLIFATIVMPAILVADVGRGEREIEIRAINTKVLCLLFSTAPVGAAIAVFNQSSDFPLKHVYIALAQLCSFVINHPNQFKVWPQTTKALNQTQHQVIKKITRVSVSN